MKLNKRMRLILMQIKLRTGLLALASLFLLPSCEVAPELVLDPEVPVPDIIVETIGEIDWITQIGTGTRDNTNGKDPNNQINAVAGNDACQDITTDADGFVYCVGFTSSSLADTHGGNGDAFITKFTSTGEIIWTTHLGTSTRDNLNGKDPNGELIAINALDICEAVVVDDDGNVYCSGYTRGSMSDTFGGLYDSVIMKLDSDGVIQWVTQFGQDTRDNINLRDPNGQLDAVNGDDGCYGVAIDDDGNVYCVGITNGGLNDTASGYDAFAVKLDSDGVIQWLTHIGTGTRDNTNGKDPNGQVDAVNGTEWCSGMDIDSDNNVYMSCSTTSNFNDTASGTDMLIIKLDSDGIIEWASHIGTDTRDNVNGKDPNNQVLAVNSADIPYRIKADSSGNVYVSLLTMSGLNDTAGGAYDAGILKLNNTGAIEWITHLGTGTRDNTNGKNPNNQVLAVNGDNACYGIDLDAFGNVYCVGTTVSGLNDVLGGSTDAFIMKVLASNGNIEWVTHMGQNTRDNINDLNPNLQINSVTLVESLVAINVGPDGYLYCAGSTTSNFADTNGGGGQYDAFIMKLK